MRNMELRLMAAEEEWTLNNTEEGHELQSRRDEQQYMALEEQLGRAFIRHEKEEKEAAAREQVSLSCKNSSLPVV